MNDLVARSCPGIAAAYHGACSVAGRRWLVWQASLRCTLYPTHPPPFPRFPPPPQCVARSCAFVCV